MCYFIFLLFEHYEHNMYFIVAHYSNLELLHESDVTSDNGHVCNQNPLLLAPVCTGNENYKCMAPVVTIHMLVNHFKKAVSIVNWFLIESTDEYIKFMYFDKELINGIQVARCVTVHTDLTWQVTVHGTTIENAVFTTTNSVPPTKLGLTSDLDTLVNMVGMNSKLCPGMQQPRI